MPSWKKLITSGSAGSLSSLSLDTALPVSEGGTGATTAAGARSNLGVDAAGTDNSTNVTLAGTPDYITISGQQITRNQIDLGNDVTGTLPVGNGGTGATSLTSNSLLTGNGTSAIQAESNVTYDGSVFKIAGNNTRAGLTLQTSNNVNDRGIGFLNSGGSYNALIYVSDAGSNQGNIVFSTGTVSGTLSEHTPSMTLDDSANLNVVGDVVAFYSSDKRLKDNIIRIENPLEKIKKIGGYEFDWNDKQKTYEGHDVGVIAQEIQEVLPELVTKRDNGYLAVKYEKLVPLLIESIKEQQKQIDEIKQKCDCLNK